MVDVQDPWSRFASESLSLSKKGWRNKLTFVNFSDISSQSTNSYYNLKKPDLFYSSERTHTILFELEIFPTNLSTTHQKFHPAG